MTRASSEAKRQRNGTSSNQRLVAAGTQAVESHARVRRSAEHLCEELEHVTSTNGVPTTDLDPEDSMVVAVEKVITTARSTIPPPFGGPAVPASRTSTKPGVAPTSRKPSVAPIRKPTGG